MPTRAKDRGFTLIEILVVTGVIGILLGIAVPAYNEYREQGKIAAAKQVLKDIERAIIALATDTGRWPERQYIGYINNASGNEIYGLSDPEIGLVATDGSFSNWRGPYISAIPLDPWGKNYFLDTDYRINGDDNIVLGSLGPSQCCNNQYKPDDIRLILPCKKDPSGDCLVKDWSP